MKMKMKMKMKMNRRVGLAGGRTFSPCAVLIVSWLLLIACDEQTSNATNSPSAGGSDGAQGGGGTELGDGGSSDAQSSTEGGVDAGALPTSCPPYEHLPHDGEWVADTLVTESDCPEVPVGSSLASFSTLTITTTVLEAGLPGEEDLKLWDADGNYYRGRVREDQARPSGPISPGSMGVDLTTQFFLNFEGNCLYGAIEFDSSPQTASSCEYRALLYATRPDSQWK